CPRRFPGTCKIGRRPATSAEAGVECPIAVVARQREVQLSIDGSVSCHDEPPVRLLDDGNRRVLGMCEVGGHLTAGAEAGVERATSRLSVGECRGKHHRERNQCVLGFEQVLQRCIAFMLHSMCSDTYRSGEESEETPDWRYGTGPATREYEQGTRERVTFRSF